MEQVITQVGDGESQEKSPDLRGALWINEDGEEESKKENVRKNAVGLCEQLCWSCKFAYGDCPWSDLFEPVPGWDAVEHKKKPGHYRIYNCPLFVRG